MQKPIFTWNPDTYEAGCIITYKDKVFAGYAIAHPDDRDLAGELTGSNIAELRANISLLQHRRDNELNPALKALNQLYYSMKHSTHFNEKSYENKMLYRQIKLHEEELNEVKNLLQTLREELKNYIDNKDKRFKQIRKHRQKSQLNPMDEIN